MAAEPQAVWDVLADFGSLSSWAEGIDHSCVLTHGDGPIGTARRLQVGRNTLVETITAFAAPTELAYEIAGLPRRFGRLTNRWTLAGATTVTLTSTVDIGDRPAQRLAERVIVRLLAKQSDALLTGLAKRVEHQHV